MSRLSRREAARRLLSGGAAFLAAHKLAFGVEYINSMVRGVQIGAQSYSFRDRDLDACIEGYVRCGLGECELWQGHLEPKDASTDELRKWRLETPLSHFRRVREKFDRARVLLYAYNYSFGKNMTDAEIERGFQMAQAMGVNYITASSNVSLAPKIDPYAEKYKIMVGFHGHDDTSDPDAFSTAETFARALRGASPYLAVNLDIGHFVAAGGDPVDYIRQHHDKIVTLHIKDRRKNHGPTVPFGQGDTPIGPVLRLLRDNHWKIPANLEYEYNDEIKGLDTIEEVKKCSEYCKKALES